MSIKFNLTGLKNIFLEALERDDPTLAFEIHHGNGRFAFFMFFSQEDKKSKDRLFIQLRNTQVFLELKAYGSHKKGDFFIYFNTSDQQAVMNELQLGNGNSGFDFQQFLGQLNTQIPATLPLQNKLDKIREVWPEVKGKLKHVVDQSDKTILIGIRKVPTGKKPQDKTLRKLYIYTNGNSDVITNLIAALKHTNYTTAWTNDEKFAAKSLAEIMTLLNT